MMSKDSNCQWSLCDVNICHIVVVVVVVSAVVVSVLCQNCCADTSSSLTVVVQ